MPARPVLWKPPMRTDGTATLDHYLKPLIDHKALVAAVTAVTTALAVGAAFVLPSRYQSTASVLLTPISGNPLAPLESDTEVDMETELLISTSKAVVTLVADDLAAQSISVDTDELSDSVSAASPQESRVLDLTYEAGTPQLAQVGANTFATNYLEYRAQIAAEKRAEAVDALNSRVELLKEELADIESRLAPLEEGTQPYVALSVERDSVDGELDAQQEALAALSTLSVSAGEVLSPALIPTQKSGPGLVVLAVGGLVGGLVMGSVLAMLVSAVKASNAPRNRRASDRIERNRRQGDRPIGGRRATDLPTESAVEKLARVTAGRDGREDGDTADGGQEGEVPVMAAPHPEQLTTAPEPAENDVNAEEADREEGDEAEAGRPDHSQPEVVVHQGAPPPPPGATTTEPQPADHDDRSEPAAEQQSVGFQPRPESLPAGESLAAHFGADVPPPPRNKAKLAKSPESAPPLVNGVVANGSRPPELLPEEPVELPKITPSDLVVEPDIGRLLGEISNQIGARPLTCLTVGQESRAQSVALGFALVDGLKELGIDVLLIDAVLDEPVLATVLDLPDAPGLSEILVGQATMKSAAHELEDLDGLHAITTGRPTALARSAFSSSHLPDMLREAKEHFPVTVILAGDLLDAGIMVRTDGELDGLVVACAADAGEPAGPPLTNRLSDLGAPTWIRVSMNRVTSGAQISSSGPAAATATTTA